MKIKTALATAGLCLLAACGTMYEESPVVTIAKAAIPALGGGPPGDPAAMPPGFRPNEVAANPGAYRLITIQGLYPAGLARLTESHGGSQTYESQYAFSAAFENGVLLSTRGLADDLMAANPGALLQTIRAGGGTTRRVHETLTGLDQIVTTSFDCTVEGGAREAVNLGLREAEATAWEETCVGGGVQFTNKYWLDNTGEIIASRQFVTQTVAYLRENGL
ncbi:YjbF family lipoprotein [Pseudoroseicyclus sp. CXY001]|uniref:YjbF family lipoprotein n=1 Tax=Pseudoroseicyclus sp. CXY001 TaxID=3242492 RepID=UPI00357128AF